MDRSVAVRAARFCTAHAAESWEKMSWEEISIGLVVVCCFVIMLLGAVFLTLGAPGDEEEPPEGGLNVRAF